MNIGMIGAASLGFANYEAYAGVLGGGSLGLGLSGVGSEQSGSVSGTGMDENSGRVGASEENVKPGFRSSPEDCETCRERKYQDGSDENVSFKSASHISPQAAGAAVRAHEGEHVANAYKKAAEEGGRVIHAGVAIHTAVCPECGRTYVAGGVTNTTLEVPRDENQKKNPYVQNAMKMLGDIGVGARANYAV